MNEPMKCTYCNTNVALDNILKDSADNVLCADCYESYLDFVNESAAEEERDHRQWRQYNNGMEITHDGYPTPAELD